MCPYLCRLLIQSVIFSVSRFSSSSQNQNLLCSLLGLSFLPFFRSLSHPRQLLYLSFISSSFQSFLSYCFLFPVSVPPSPHLPPLHISSLLCLFFFSVISPCLFISFLLSLFTSFLPSFLPSVLPLSHFSSHPSSSLVSSDSKSRPGSDSSPL